MLREALKEIYGTGLVGLYEESGRTEWLASLRCSQYICDHHVSLCVNFLLSEAATLSARKPILGIHCRSEENDEADHDHDDDHDPHRLRVFANGSKHDFSIEAAAYSPSRTPVKRNQWQAKTPLQRCMTVQSCRRFGHNSNTTMDRSVIVGVLLCRLHDFSHHQHHPIPFVA